MAKKEITVTFKTITPLWTGDAWGECNELKLTGIVGSLRWWFEALVRGMGYNACNSTGNNKCQIEIKKPEDILNIHNKICPVCYLFGATGWKSRFGVREQEQNNNLKPINEIEIRTRTNKHKVKGQNKYLSRFCDGLFGNFKVVFYFMPDIAEEHTSLFVKLLQIINTYGMIGSKISQGNGVCEIKIVTDEPYKNVKIKDKIRDIILTKRDTQKKYYNYPNFRNFKFLILRLSFFENIENICQNLWRKNVKDNKSDIKGDVNNLWENYSILPISFHIRDLLRGLWRTNRGIRHSIMGERGKGANVFISHGYKISDKVIEVRIVADNLDEEKWESIKATLNPNNLNNYLWVNKKNNENNSYVSSVSIVKEILGQKILKEE